MPHVKVKSTSMRVVMTVRMLVMVLSKVATSLWMRLALLVEDPSLVPDHCMLGHASCMLLMK